MQEQTPENTLAPINMEATKSFSPTSRTRPRITRAGGMLDLILAANLVAALVENRIAMRR